MFNVCTLAPKFNLRFTSMNQVRCTELRPLRKYKIMHWKCGVFSSLNFENLLINRIRSAALIRGLTVSSNLIIHVSVVREPNFENCLDVIFVASSCENVIFVSEKNYYITSANRKFMLGHLISWWLPKRRPLNLSSTGLRPFENMWFKSGKN